MFIGINSAINFNWFGDILEVNPQLCAIFKRL